MAFAAWLVEREGEGSTRVSQLQTPTITPVPNPSGGSCLPGGLCDASFRIQNPNGVPLQVQSIAMAANSSGTSNTSGCPFGLLAVEPRNGLSIPVAASATTDVTVPQGFRLDASADSACQGAVLTRSAKLTFSTP